MNEIKYLTHAPTVYRIKARYLEVGMFHLAKCANNSYEVARICGVEAISGDCIQIDLGPVGHANRVVQHDQYVDVPQLHCPKCLEDTELSTDLHVGIALTCCLKCSYRGPELLAKGDNQPLLARVLRDWNNLPL